MRLSDVTDVEPERVINTITVIAILAFILGTLIMFCVPGQGISFRKEAFERIPVENILIAIIMSTSTILAITFAISQFTISGISERYSPCIIEKFSIHPKTRKSFFLLIYIIIGGYVPMGQKRFFTREMNLIINFMRLIFNENDKVNLHYICGYWGINYDRVIEALNNNTFLQNLIDIYGKDIIPDPILNKLDQFRNSKKDFWQYYKELKDNIIGKNMLDEDLLEDIELFEKTYERYTYDRESHSKSLGDFLNYLSLSPKKDLTNKGVALLTGHAAKGLEFSFVFLISMNQGIFPDYRAKNGSRALEEERRNCFVAVTRTKKKLFISYTKFKNTRCGQRKQEPSQFLKEMGLIS